MGKGRSRMIGRLIFPYTKVKHARLWNEMSSFGRICLPQILGAVWCLALSQLVQVFPAKGMGSFRPMPLPATVIFVVSKVLIKCWMWSVWIIWASKDFTPSCDSLRDVVVNYCIALYRPSYLWFNLRTSLSSAPANHF